MQGSSLWLDGPGDQAFVRVQASPAGRFVMWWVYGANLVGAKTRGVAPTLDRAKADAMAAMVVYLRRARATLPAREPIVYDPTRETSHRPRTSRRASRA